MLHRNLEGSDSNIYRKTLVRPLLLSCILALILIIIDRLIGINGYVSLCISGIVYMSLFLIGIYWGNYLDDFDRATISKINPLQLLK